MREGGVLIYSQSKLLLEDIDLSRGFSLFMSSNENSLPRVEDALDTQAGEHPYGLATSVDVNSENCDGYDFQVPWDVYE